MVKPDWVRASYSDSGNTYTIFEKSSIMPTLLGSIDPKSQFCCSAHEYIRGQAPDSEGGGSRQRF